MTFDEIQKTIEGMLSVQRNLQENQIKIQENQTRFEANQLEIQRSQLESDRKIDKLTDRINNLTEQVENLNIVSQRHEDRFTQFYGYHQSAETDRMRLFERERGFWSRSISNHVVEMQDRIELRLGRIERKLDDAR